MKKKLSPEVQLLNLLKEVLPSAVDDPRLAQQIYGAVEGHLQRKHRAESFEQYCQKCDLPDLQPATIMDLKRQLAESFGKEAVTVAPNEEKKTVEVTVALPEGEFVSEIKVKPVGDDPEEDPAASLKFVPFPVCLPGDRELVWVMARRENLTAEEAAIALAKIEDDFWNSKTGLKLQRDRVEKCFPEFVARVPAGMLSESGLKRHYKEPEPIKTLVLRDGAPQNRN